MVLQVRRQAGAADGADTIGEGSGAAGQWSVNSDQYAASPPQWVLTDKVRTESRRSRRQKVPAAPRGTPIYAAGSGVVESSGETVQVCPSG